MKRPELTNEELILGQKVRNKGWEIRKYLGIGGFDGTIDVGDDDDDDTEEGEGDRIDIDSLLPWSIFKNSLVAVLFHAVALFIGRVLRGSLLEL